MSKNSTANNEITPPTDNVSSFDNAGKTDDEAFSDIIQFFKK